MSGMQNISLTRGYIAVVDDEDVKWLKLFSWCVSIGKDITKPYAVTRRGGRKAKNTFMHRIIIDCPENMCVDHINGNTLDNRKENLRICTTRQNLQNARRPIGKSGYRGVYYKSGKYYVRVKDEAGNKIHGGGFAALEDAAHHYDKLAKHYYGEFARLNFPEG